MLIVDTTRSGLLDDFSHYFEARRESSRFILSLDAELLEILNSIDCYPAALTGGIGSWLSP